MPTWIVVVAVFLAIAGVVRYRSMRRQQRRQRRRARRQRRLAYQRLWNQFMHRPRTKRLTARGRAER